MLVCLNKNRTLCANIKVNEIAAFFIIFFFLFFSIFSGFAIRVVLVICFWLINSIKVLAARCDFFFVIAKFLHVIEQKLNTIRLFVLCTMP